MTPLQRRKALFAEMSSRFPHRKVSELVSVYHINDKKMGEIRKALRNYMAIMDELDSITPNGMMVPSREAGLEFNVLAREFWGIMAGMGIQDYAANFNVPFNVRVKRQGIQSDGPRATELRHTDAWLHEDPKSCLVNFFINGSCKDNHLRYYDPSTDFDESWLSPRQFADGQDIADRYTPLDFIPEDGDLVLCDFSAIHQTCRKPDAGERVSIDTVFALKYPNEAMAYQCRYCNGTGKIMTGLNDVFVLDRYDCPGCEGTGVKQLRQYRGQRAGWDVLTGIGQTHLLVFPNSADEWVDCDGGRKQAVNCQVKQLN